MDYKKEKKRDRKNIVILGLAIVVILLLVVLAYAFLIKPRFNGYVVNKQIEASEATANNVVKSILLSVQNNGYVQLQVPGGNQSIILVPYNPQ